MNSEVSLNSVTNRLGQSVKYSFPITLRDSLRKWKSEINCPVAP